MDVARLSCNGATLAVDELVCSISGVDLQAISELPPGKEAEHAAANAVANGIKKWIGDDCLVHVSRQGVAYVLSIKHSHSSLSEILPNCIAKWIKHAAEGEADSLTFSVALPHSIISQARLSCDSA